MGFFRFRRSFKLFPGIRWNIGKKSTSLSIGGRGANYTVGTSGSRTTVGIPGTGLSYTDIHHSHTRVSGHRNYTDVPPPSKEWLEANKPNIHFHFPDRHPDEPPATPEQLREIQGMGQLAADCDWKTLGYSQADNLVAQMKEAKSKYSKQVLRRYYREQGASVPSWLIDHVVDHPDKPLPGGSAPKKGHGCMILVGILLFIGWLSNLGKKEESAPRLPVVNRPPHVSAQTSGIKPQVPSSPSASRPASTPIIPIPTKVSEEPPTPSAAAFPDPKYWPKEVRISSPVVLRGNVDGGTIHQSAKPGAVLSATLSLDHKTVTLRRLDISGSLPLGSTDFEERARRAVKARN